MLQGPATFILAILGCGEGEAQCQQVQIAPVQYSSESQCMSASGDALARQTGLAFPVVVAECRRSGVQSASIRADDVRRPEGQTRVPIRTAAR